MPATRRESEFRHRSWALQRRKTWESLLRLHVNSSRLDRFRECGSGLWLRRDVDTGEIHLGANTCRDRLCKACGGDRAAKIVAALQEPMADQTNRFVTLTKRLNSLNLSDNLDLLYEQFVRLRHRKWWRENVSGGAAFLEIKYRPSSKTWNVHFHLILQGKFLPQKELSREWLASTGDSSVVDVRAIADNKQRAVYVTKYVTKPADETVWSNAEALDEFIGAIRGRRLCFTFGSWRGYKLNDDDGERPNTEPVGSIEGLRREAESGDENSLSWLIMAAKKWPALAQVFGITLESG